MQNLQVVLAGRQLSLASLITSIAMSSMLFSTLDRLGGPKPEYPQNLYKTDEPNIDVVFNIYIDLADPSKDIPKNYIKTYEQHMSKSKV